MEELKQPLLQNIINEQGSSENDGEAVMEVEPNDEVEDIINEVASNDDGDFVIEVNDEGENRINEAALKNDGEIVTEANDEGKNRINEQDGEAVMERLETDDEVDNM